MDKVIFWDFDGTLAYRDGMFSKALLEVLDEHEKPHNYRLDDLKPFLQDGFPWHRPEIPHPELNDPAAWWDFVEKIFIRAYEGIGIGHEKATVYAKLAHLRYIDPTKYSLYDDTEETLNCLLNKGWRHIILSNHVPELPAIVLGLGLEKYIEDCISSANIGYEKPHPEIFRIALKQAGNPNKVWMIGDNYLADVKGAEDAGLKAILVRNVFREDVKYYAKTLHDIIQIIEND